MSYVNVGAYVNGKRPTSKKALREALRDAPSLVRFDVTSMMGPRAGETITADSIGTDTLSVVGPDPYTRRTWYASVKVNTNGKITLS